MMLCLVNGTTSGSSAQQDRQDNAQRYERAERRECEVEQLRNSAIADLLIAEKLPFQRLESVFLGKI